MIRIAGWCLLLTFGVFTLFRVAEAWIRPHRATALFETTSISLVIIGVTLIVLSLKRLSRTKADT